MKTICNYGMEFHWNRPILLRHDERGLSIERAAGILLHIHTYYIFIDMVERDARKCAQVG